MLSSWFRPFSSKFSNVLKQKFHNLRWSYPGEKTRFFTEISYKIRISYIKQKVSYEFVQGDRDLG